MKKLIKNIGFIGLGNMGSKMAIHLAKAGYKVQGYDLNQNIFDPLIKFGIEKSESLTKFAIDKDVIITMLPNGEIVKDVILKMIDDIKENCLVLDSSTINVKTAIELNEILSKKKISYLDGPVSGGTIGAENGTLTFMVGGDFKSFEFITPILELMGSKSVYCGKSGSGQAVKLCNNMLLAITMIGVGECFNMGKNLNIDLKILYEVISTATGSCWSVNKYCPIPGIGPNSPSDNDYEGGFSAKLMSKDLKLAVNAGKNSNSNINFGILAEKIYTDMANGDNGNKDFSRVIREID